MVHQRLPHNVHTLSYLVRDVITVIYHQDKLLVDEEEGGNCADHVYEHLVVN